MYDVFNMGNSWVKEKAFIKKELLEDKENITIAPKLDGILNFSFNKDSAAKAMKKGEIEAK